MRIKTIAAIVFALTAFEAKADTVLFPKLVSWQDYYSQPRPLAEAYFAQEFDAFSRAASLRTLRAGGPFELRVWRMGVMSGEGQAHVIAEGWLKTFRTRRFPDGRVQAVLTARRRIAAGKLPAAELRALSDLSGNWFGCGWEDGESIRIEASLDGRPLQVAAGDLAECSNPSADRITALLRAVDTLAQVRTGPSK